MAETSEAKQKLISVIIPAYNAGRFLAEALESIFAQDYRPIEVIVIDDGSTDDTATIAQSYPEVRYVYEERQGSAVARNTGLALSSGEFVTFLDADDLWSSNKLSLQAEFLAQNPENQCVGGKMLNFLHDETECPFWIDPNSLRDPLSLPSFCSIMVRRSLFDNVGQFNPEYLQGQDLEWFFRLKESNVQVFNLEETVVLRRIHASNISHNQSTQAQMRLRMLKESIERKRTRVCGPPSEVDQ